jgi:outer membrane protein
VKKGLETNLEILQSQLTAKENKINFNQSKTDLLPDLNATASSGINSGRSIDPFTNDYINQQIKYSSYGVSSNLILFNGLSLQNTVRQNRSLYDAAEMDLEQTKDNIAINITLAYLQALNNEDQLAQAERQAQLSLEQVKRLEKMSSEGAISPYLLTDLKGQYSSDQLGIINARNSWQLSKIELFRLMNLPYDEKIRFQRMDSVLIDMSQEQSPSQIYGKAVNELPQIKAVALRESGALYGWRAARGRLFPTLSFGASANTNYSSAAGIKYGTQLDNNLFKSFSLNLSVPLFNGFFARNRIRLAEIFHKNTMLIASTTKTRLQQSIEEAYAQLTAARERYITLQEQVAAYQESFRSATIRFNEGVINSVDYLTAKNNLDRANASLITARYDYLLRKKIIDYYQGQSLR